MRSPLNSLLPAVALTLLLCLGTRHNVEARRVRITHSTTAADTLRIADPHTLTITDSLTLATDLRLSGYDKTRESDRESLFVTNRSPHTLTSLTLSLNYHASDGRQLHQRRVTVKCLIPPGETRLVDFRSWDRQHSFYYHRSRRPARTVATPYHLSVTILSATATTR